MISISGGGCATISHGMCDVNLKSITAYRDMKARYDRNGDNIPFPFCEGIIDDTQGQLSQEFQLNGKSFSNRLTWIAGFYFFKEHATDEITAGLAIGL